MSTAIVIASCDTVLIAFIVDCCRLFHMNTTNAEFHVIHVAVATSLCALLIKHLNSRMHSDGSDRGVPRISHWGKTGGLKADSGDGGLGEGAATPSHHLWVSGAL